MAGFASERGAPISRTRFRGNAAIQTKPAAIQKINRYPDKIEPSPQKTPPVDSPPSKRWKERPPGAVCFRFQPLILASATTNFGLLAKIRLFPKIRFSLA